MTRFPKSCDARLIEGLNKLSANCSRNFISQRSLPHLIRIFVIQFALQKRVESAIAAGQYHFFTKFFLYKSSLCLINFIPFSAKEQVIDKDTLMRTLQRLIPGVREITGSFWRWLHPELPYMCIYIEVQRLRGKEFSSHDLRNFNTLLEEQLALQVRAPSLFWPFNEEEAYKQLRVLLNELRSSNDLPQVTIHFRQQTAHSLEWLIHIAKHHDLPLEKKVGALPPSVRFFLHFLHEIDTKEMGCFSLFLPLQQFNEQHTINLLQARDRVVRHLQCLLGPFRDYNGGLFETQRDTFIDIFRTLADHIPHFTLFADKAFHALQPVEARIALSLEDLKHLLQTISLLMCQSRLDCYTSDEGIWVFRTKEPSEIHPFALKAKQIKLIYTEFDCGSFRYFCVLDKTKAHIPDFQNMPIFNSPKTTLKIAFFTGEPPSLSPYLAGGDTRCNTISKLLFEGLMRLDASGTPQKAAAKEFLISPCGKKYTFLLRASSWSNGQSVTAFDYLHGWKMVLSRQWTSNRPYLLFAIKNGKKFYDGLCEVHEVGIKAQDFATLEIELESADGHFLEKLAQPIFFPAFRSFQEPYIFNGPYLVNMYGQNTLELESNPYYWDAHHLFFPRIRIDWNLCIEEALLRFQHQEIDWLGDSFAPLPVTEIKQLEQKGQLSTRQVLRFFLIYLNTQHPLLSSSLIRRALSLSLNRDYICTHIFPHSLPLCSPIPQFSNLEGIANENQQSTLELFERGLQNLKISKDSIPPLILTCAQLSGHIECAFYLQNIWKELFGLNVQIQKEPWNLVRSHLEKKDFQMAGCFENIFSRDPREFLQRFDDKNNPLNFSNWDHSHYQAITRAIEISTEEEKMQLIGRTLSILKDQTPYIPVCTHTLLYTKHPKLRGEVFDAGGCVDFRFSFLED